MPGSLLLKEFSYVEAQKQPPEVFYKTMCSWKSQKIHRKKNSDFGVFLRVLWNFWEHVVYRTSRAIASGSNYPMHPLQRRIEYPVKQFWSNYFPEKSHRRCLTGSYIRLLANILWIDIRENLTNSEKNVFGKVWC